MNTAEGLKFPRLTWKGLTLKYSSSYCFFQRSPSELKELSTKTRRYVHCDVFISFGTNEEEAVIPSPRGPALSSPSPLLLGFSQLPPELLALLRHLPLQRDLLLSQDLRPLPQGPAAPPGRRGRCLMPSSSRTSRMLLGSSSTLLSTSVRHSGQRSSPREPTMPCRQRRQKVCWQGSTLAEASRRSRHTGHSSRSSSTDSSIFSSFFEVLLSLLQR